MTAVNSSYRPWHHRLLLRLFWRLYERWPTFRRAPQIPELMDWALGREVDRG